MVHALRGKEHVEWDNPYDVGMTGLIGFSSGYYAMHRLRHFADARDRLSRIGSSIRRVRRRASRRSTSGRNNRPAGAGGPRASSATWARRCRRCCRSSRKIPNARISTGDANIIARRAKASMNWRPASPGRRPIHPQQIAQGHERPRGRRCDLHLRRRAADGLGRALSGDERQAAAARIVLARLDGQRDGAGDRCAGGVPRPAGDFAVGRRRIRHADGRSSQPGAAATCR